MTKEFLTTQEFAWGARVTDRIVRIWAISGKVMSFRTPGGHFRIPSSELMRLKLNSVQTLVARDDHPS